MRPRGYKVLFTDPPAGPGVHRIRNFAEDLHRRLSKGGVGVVPNMDSAEIEVLVEVSASRHLGTALQAIRLQLQRSLFDDNIQVEPWD